MHSYTTPFALERCDAFFRCIIYCLRLGFGFESGRLSFFSDFKQKLSAYTVCFRRRIYRIPPFKKLLNVMHRTWIFYNSLIYGSLLDYNNLLAGQSYSNFAICFYFSKSACYKQAVLRSCLVFPRLSWGQNKLINNDFPSWTMVTTPCQIAKELQTTWNKIGKRSQSIFPDKCHLFWACYFEILRCNSFRTCTLWINWLYYNTKQSRNLIWNTSARIFWSLLSNYVE